MRFSDFDPSQSSSASPAELALNAMMLSTAPRGGWSCHRCGHMRFEGLVHHCPTATGFKGSIVVVDDPTNEAKSH